MARIRAVTFRSSRLWWLAGVLLLLLAGCASDPIEFGELVRFRHRLGVFEMQVPKGWKQAQDAVGTEALAAFSDPSGRAEIIGYTGLLDHTLTADERSRIVQGLVKNLLNGPADLQFGAGTQQPDGAYQVTMTFTRNNVKRTGEAVFRDGDLSLSGVLVSGPQSDWTDLQAKYQPVIASFVAHRENVEGTYFEPINQTHFALVVPVDWAHTGIAGGEQIRAPGGDLTITAAQRPLAGTLDAAALTQAALTQARQLLGTLGLAGSEVLPDGRTKLTFTAGDHQVIGYAEHIDGMLITLLFEFPANRQADYQPIIDFMYSTLVTGKP